MAQLAEIQQRLARATSLLVVLRDRLPDDAHAALSLARQRGIAVDAIFHRFRDGDYLDALHREGVGLFEGALPPGDGSQLFIDCEVGYELPGWLPIEAAGSLAYQLLWRRIGVAIEVEGEVKKRAADDTLLELVAARPTFVDLRRLAAKPRLEEGAKAVVLGVVAFIGIRGAALLVDALRVEQHEGGPVMGKTRINLANPQELLEIPGLDGVQIGAILRHRVEHGPITDPSELTKLLGPGCLTRATLAHIDFAPAGESATESAGG